MGQDEPAEEFSSNLADGAFQVRQAGQAPEGPTSTPTGGLRVGAGQIS